MKQLQGFLPCGSICDQDFQRQGDFHETYHLILIVPSRLHRLSLFAVLAGSHGRKLPDGPEWRLQRGKVL